MFEGIKTLLNGAKASADSLRQQIKTIGDKLTKTAEIASNALSTAKSKANVADPVFTGSFSQNRAIGTYIGYCSHAEGDGSEASGYYSHAEGKYTVTGGYYSHAEGEYTIAASQHQHAQGRYNIKDNRGKYAHIVGNGTDTSNRSNAHTLDWDGNAWFAGTIEGTAIILKSSESSKRFKLTINDSGEISVTELT